MPKIAKESEASFEKDMDALEKIVSALEEGGLSLDESLKRFEEGSKLALRCEKALQAAETKIELLTKNASGELEAQPFDDKEEPPAKTPAPKRKATTPEREEERIPPEPEEGGDEDDMLF